jgi:probable F420-dependent oxidoreductase
MPPVADVVQRPEQARQVERMMERRRDRRDQSDPGGERAQSRDEHERLLGADRALGVEPQQIRGEEEVDLRGLGPLGDDARGVEGGPARVNCQLVRTRLAARTAHGLECSRFLGVTRAPASRLNQSVIPIIWNQPGPGQDAALFHCRGQRDRSVAEHVFADWNRDCPANCRADLVRGRGRAGDRLRLGRGGDRVESADRAQLGRGALGRVGVFLPNSPGASPPSADVQRDAARRLERAGYRTAWNNEGVGGNDGLVQLGLLLAATERMTFGSAIANIWARSPQTAHGAAALLAGAYPGRFVLGLGVGYPFQAAQVGRDYGRPLATIRDYFEQMTAGLPLGRTPQLSYPRILAANGPKMLALAGEIADGALPILVPPAYTASARQVLGPDKILVVGLTAAVDEDPDRARAAARRFVSEVVARPGSPYALNLTRLGYAAEDISAASDEVVDAIVAWGNPEQVAEGVRRHLDAGADHVRLGTTASDFQAGMDALEQLAPALTR